ncbi:DEN6B protein, partial [Polypterus senegalus]
MDLYESGHARTYTKSEKSASAVSRMPWARFSCWVECVCVVTFDLELGQAIEKTNICYLSFPDSYSGCLGDTQFSFRVRQSVGQKSSWFCEEDIYSREAPVTLQSLVVISRLPYVNLFQSLLQLIAPEYFEKLDPCLEAVCNEIDQWPAPIPGQTLNLPVMGVVIQVRIPSKNDKPGSSPLKQAYQENLLPAPMVLPTVNELDLFKCFQSLLIHIQMLWELMLLGEPIVIMAPSPTISSETVLALSSCIAPLKYCCDYRPYFTIHDSEFKEYTTRTQAPPNVILGVTNPFFIKTFQYWPHIIRIGELKMSGVYTSYKTYLHKDKALIKRLLKERYMASLMPLQKAIMPWKDLLLWIKDKSEVEIVDLVLKLREKLVKAHHQQLPVKEEVLQKLESYIQTIITSLPEDLQAVLKRH